MRDVQISCFINTTNPLSKLGLEIRLDNTVIFDSEHIQQLIKFSYELNDDDGEHLLEFVMKNKTSLDTKIDSEGNIIDDSRIIISNLAFLLLLVC